MNHIFSYRYIHSINSPRTSLTAFESIISYFQENFPYNEQPFNNKMLGFFDKLKIKLSGGPPRGQRYNDGDWEDDDDPERRHLDPYIQRREHDGNVPGWGRGKLKIESNSPRGSGGIFSLRSNPRSSRDRNSIYKRSGDLSGSPRNSRDKYSRSRDWSRGRVSGSELRRSGDGHRRRRRKSSHPKELSRNRHSDSRVNESTPAVPPISSIGEMFRGLKLSGERYNDRMRRDDKDRLQADKKRLNRHIQDKEERVDRQIRQVDKPFEDDWEKQRGADGDKERTRKEAAEEANPRARRDLEEDRAGERREREARENEEADQQGRAQPKRANSVPLTAANLKTSADSASDSGDSAKSELNRGIGNMARTIIEGMLPREEILEEQRKQREDAVRQRQRR